MGAFHNKNLLYRPSLSFWQARKKDKSASAEITEAKSAKNGTANVNKSLMPGNVDLDNIRKWVDQFRDFVYTNTLPWDDGGWRIGRADRHMEFMAKLGDMQREGEALVEKFIDGYDTAIEQASFELADLFDRNDYPGKQDLRSKFKFVVDVQVVPDAEDFRIVDGLPADQVDKLVQQAVDNQDTRFREAMNVAFEKLFTVVQKFGTTLEQFGAGEIRKFNDTLVGNISELVEAMPALNIMGDKRLDDLTARARELTTYAVVDLRKQPEVRAAAVKEAHALAELFKGVFATEDAGQVVAPTSSPAPAPAPVQAKVPPRPPKPPQAAVGLTTVTPEKPQFNFSGGMSLREAFADMMNGD